MPIRDGNGRVSWCVFGVAITAIGLGAMNARAAESPALTTLPRHIAVTEQLHVSGQPTVEALAALPGAGVKTVINLRPAAETPGLDERQAVEKAGMRYQALPVSGVEDLTRDNVAAFDRLLRESEGQPVLVHCASGNRVGAMMALRARWLQGKSTEESLAIGKAAGLTGLAPAVERRLAE